MDADEQEIITYLKVWKGQFISGREIARKASGKRRFQDEPAWAVAPLARLIEKKTIEADASAHYRLISESKKHKTKRWISPHIQKILDKTGKDFSEGVEIDKPENLPPSTPEQGKPGA